MPSNTSPSSLDQLLSKYAVPSMGLYTEAGGEVSLILERLDVNGALSPEDKKFIRDKGLFDLYEFVKELEKTGKPNFRALRPKVQRDEKTQVRRALWDKYQIGFVDPPHVRKMITILLQVEEGGRISDKDTVWLSTNEYFSDRLRRIFHRNEATFYQQSFEKSGDPWDAVNGSSHFRKANLSEKAVMLLGHVDIDKVKDKHIKSALCTTKGGAKRDLRRLEEAFQLAEKAHSFEPQSFHPCTLLGALHYENGDYESGDVWFAKAIERGAEDAGVDQELRSIFKRADKLQKSEMKRHLLSIDPKRYHWVN